MARQSYTDQQRIRIYLQGRRTGATCDEVEQALGIPHQTASKRLGDIERLGVAERVNRFRRTRHGGLAQVYESVEG